MLKDCFEGKRITCAELAESMYNHDIIRVQTTEGAFLVDKKNIDKTGKSIVIKDAIELNGLRMISKVTINPESIVSTEEM